MCTKEAKSCELSNAEIVTVNGKDYLLSTNDKDFFVNTFIFYDLEAVIGKQPTFLAKLLKSSPPFTAHIQPSFILKNTQGKFADKIESLASLGNWVLVVGSYSPYKNTKANKAIGAFQVDQNKKLLKPHIISDPELYPKLQQALRKSQNTEPPSYIKVEAATVVPVGLNHKLLLGIRTHDNGPNTPMKDVIKILAVDIKENGETVELGENIDFIHGFQDNQGHGISGLSYEPNTQTLLMTTSYENSDTGELDGALWKCNLTALLASRNACQIIERASFKGHKPEGVTPLRNKDHYLALVIFDDDRTASKMLNGKKRQLYESPFYVIDTR